MKVYKRIVCRVLPVLMAVFFAAGCRSLSNPAQPEQAVPVETDTAETDSVKQETGQAEAGEADTAENDSAKSDAAQTEASKTETAEAVFAEEGTAETDDSKLPAPGIPDDFVPAMVPEYSGSIWADVNEDVPFFDEKQMEAARRMAGALSLQNGQGYSYQAYGELDALGRCTGACALVGPETLPQEARGNIGMIKPTGWHTVKYDGIEGNYLYNRCHLIGFQLTGQDANEKNLITGTRSMNVEGMLPYEDSVLAYVKGTGNHVLYRVTPVFREDNLLADGVLMEARSVEDPLVQFCAFCYNVQPGIEIDYATGESSGPEFSGNHSSEDAASGQTGNTGTGIVRSGMDGTEAEENEQDKSVPNRSAEEGKDSSAPNRSAEEGNGSSVPNRSAEGSQDQAEIGEWKYIINVSSRKFHRPGCESVQKMSRKNRQGFNGSREELIEMGYVPCKNCNP